MPTGSAPPRPPDSNLAGLRIFISYPRGGAAHTCAKRIHADLAARGANVWRDETGILDGDPDWYAAIRDGLERADLALGVFGHDSEHCRWQKREMLRADDLGLPVVAALMADAGVPLYAQERQATWHWLADSQYAHVSRLVAEVGRLLGGWLRQGSGTAPPP